MLDFDTFIQENCNCFRSKILLSENDHQRLTNGKSETKIDKIVCVCPQSPFIFEWRALASGEVYSISNVQF